MTLEGFAYDDPRSPEAFTFVAETYAQRIDEDARKKYKCDAIRTKKLPNLNMPNDLYYCELSLDKADVQKLEISELCKLATHQSTQGKRWNVGPESIYAEEAIRRGSKCDVSSDSEKDLSVAQVQTRLHNLGYNPGPVDDAWGKKTSTALKMFMNSLGIEDIDPESLKARSILYDFYDQEFEQVVDSSVPCSEITNDFETDFGPCVVIAHYNETSSNLVAPEKGNETTSIWDKKAIYPHLRKRKDNLLEVVIWAPDMPRKAQTVHDLPGLAHMANFPVNIKKIFSNQKGIEIKNKSRTMPVSVRRYALSDLDSNGIEELVLLGDGEDGRGVNYYNKEKVGANQKNEMYNFQMEKIEQSIKDIQKYENVSDFNKEVYSRWNL